MISFSKFAINFIYNGVMRGMKSLGNGLYVKENKKYSSYVMRSRVDGSDMVKVLGRVGDITEQQARDLIGRGDVAANDPHDSPEYMERSNRICPIHFTSKCAVFTEEEVVAVSAPRPLCGVYFLIRDRKVLYVGQSENLLDRVGRHSMRVAFTHYTMMLCEKHELDALEAHYINEFKPPLNKKWKDGTMACSKKKLYGSGIEVAYEVTAELVA